MGCLRCCDLICRIGCQARYSLAIVYQQDSLVEQAYAMFAEALAIADTTSSAEGGGEGGEGMEGRKGVLEGEEAGEESGESPTAAQLAPWEEPVLAEDRAQGGEGWREDWWQRSTARLATLYGIASCMQQVGRGRRGRA